VERWLPTIVCVSVIGFACKWAAGNKISIYVCANRICYASIFGKEALNRRADKLALKTNDINKKIWFIYSRVAAA
jgi:hypothetical protein